MKALILLAVVLASSGCVYSPVTADVGEGNNFTYSTNSAGNQTGAVLEQCAKAVVKHLKEHPEADGDTLFINCYTSNGVTFI